MKIRTTWERNWWSFSYSLKISGEKEISSFELPIYTHALINKLEIANLIGSGKIIDIKGREPSGFSESKQNSERYSELFRIRGKIFLSEQLKNGQADFTFMLLTAFDSFSGSNHIQNKIKEIRDGPIPDSLNWQELCWAVPIELQEARIGLEIFRPSFTTMLGFTPEVREHLYIELNQKQIKFQIELDSLAKKDSSWLSSSSFWIKVDQAFKEIFSLDLSTALKS